jgi:hypothetical protein
MTQTTQIIIPLLSFLVSTGGAGFIASLLFDKLRVTYQKAPQKWIQNLLYAPRYARWSVMVLALIISVGASIALAFLQGQDLLVSVDAAFAASLSVIVSQVKHSFTQSTQVKNVLT